MTSKKNQHCTFDYSLKNSAEKIGIKEESFKRILTKFINNLCEKINMLTTYITNNDYESISALSHKLKGASGNLNIMKMYEIFQFIELTARKKENQTYEKEIAQINNIHSELKKIL